MLSGATILVMHALIKSAALRGIEAIPIEVEVDVLGGLPGFTVVGLTDKSIQESRERLTAALSNMNLTPPRRKTIVSLAPASLKKEGSLYDLPIALGFLCASEQVSISPVRLANIWFIGEVGLDGSLRSIEGVLPIMLAAAEQGIRTVFIPHGNASEATALADKLEIFAARSLQEVINHLTSEASTLKPLAPDDTNADWLVPDTDLSDIKGQEQAKRALIIAAAGHHNVLMVGPPGTGKTLLARALAGILPPLNHEESFVVTSLYSVAGCLSPGTGLIKRRPFRSPHHGASAVALTGGGAIPKPGEISLAHTGVLFLDELPEFPRSVLDQLRQPIEDGVVTVARAAQTVQFPARSMLLGAMNPCPCGFIGSAKRPCRCAPGDVVRYQRRVSGPLLDRFDLHLAVTDVDLAEVLNNDERPSESRPAAEQVQAARDRQYARYGKPNGLMNNRELKAALQLDDLSRRLLYQAEKKFHLSVRSVYRLLKVARTIADLEPEDRPVNTRHVAEALQYREQLQHYLPDFI